MVRMLIQRVTRASVAVQGKVVGSIGPGMLLLVGFHRGDTTDIVDWMAGRIAGLRIFADEDGKMNLDLAAAGGAALVVSQFTLYGDATGGRRPSFVAAARPDVALPLYHALLERLAAVGVPVQSGQFGSYMQIELVNDGPVTLILERTA